MSLPDLQEPLKLLEQQDLDAAIEVLEQKVRVLPAHLVAHVLLARAYEAQRRWEQALRSWENAHFLMPNSPVVEDGKRRVLRRMDGIEDDAPPSITAAPDVDEPAETAPVEAPEEEAEEEETSTEEAPSESEASDELAQLRRQAEREARQGGARPGLADKPPAIDSPSPSDESSATPEEHIEDLEEDDATEDLDRLIDELESARIEPDPDTAEDAPEPDLEDDTEEVVSETLARIHENQADYREAARIYTKLAAQEPDRAEEFRQKADEMRKKADASEA